MSPDNIVNPGRFVKIQGKQGPKAVDTQKESRLDFVHSRDILVNSLLSIVQDVRVVRRTQQMLP